MVIEHGNQRVKSDGIGRRKTGDIWTGYFPEIASNETRDEKESTSAYDPYLQELKHQNAKPTMSLRRLTLCRSRISSQAGLDMADNRG